MYRTATRISYAISFWIIAVLAAAVPLFFLPASWGGVVAVKSVLLYGGVFLATACWLFAQFLQGSLTVPRHRILAVLGVWMVAVLLSALASANTHVSLWGRGFALDSWITVLVLSLIVFLVSSFAREQRRLVTLFLATFVGSALTILLQVIFFAVHTSGLAHVAATGTLVGSWVDFSYLTTLTLIIALLMYEVLAPKGLFRLFSLVTMILCTLVLIFLNFTTAWIVAIISALLVFVYNSSVERSLAKLFPRSAETKERSGFPFLSFSVLIIGVFFLLTSASVGARIAQSINLRFSDIRPSFATTNYVVRHSLTHDPLLGVGPGRFAPAWDLYHPMAINQTTFWNASFDAGFSTVQSLIVTQGLLPVLLFICMIVLSVVHGFRLFSYKFPDRFSRFIAVASLIMVIAYTLLCVLTSVGTVLTVIGFVYIGLLIGVSQLVGKTQLVTWTYLKDPRKSFLTILALVLCIILCVAAIYMSSKRFASIVYFNRALIGDVASSEQALARAITLAPNDVYWRGRTSLYMGQFLKLANTESPDKAQLQNNFDAAAASASAAVAWDRTDAHNWLILAQVYQLIAANGNPDALAAAQQAIDRAHTQSPVNPLYLIVKGQIVFAAKDYAEALKVYTAARELAPANADAWIGMVDSLTALGRKSEATELLDQFAIAFPTIKGVDQKKQSIQPPVTPSEKSDTKQ